MHFINSSVGGRVRVGISQALCSFNIFSLYSAYCHNEVFENIWPSLFKIGPDITPVPDIATNLLIETHSDNPNVPDGHTRFTVDIVENATWSDGTPLTADDIAFTYVYAKESAPYGYPAGKLASDMVAVYAPTLSTAVVEYTTESYWHLNNFAFRYIIPVHIFNNSGGIGYEGWETWNPVFDTEEPHVTCGPFIFSDYVDDNFYRMIRNPQFHYAVSPPSTTTTTSTITTNQTTTPDMFWPVMISTAAITGVGMIVVVYAVIGYQNRRR
jgi:peptide/nickel transport system substrate-binding protein